MVVFLSVVVLVLKKHLPVEFFPPYRVKARLLRRAGKLGLGYFALWRSSLTCESKGGRGENSKKGLVSLSKVT